MRILVLGGTGYVGSKLIKEIVDDDEVYCAVRRASNLFNMLIRRMWESQNEYAT